MIARAGTRDPEVVRAMGISLRPALAAIFALGVGLAGLAGVMSAPLAGVQPAMGAEILTAAFVVVVRGVTVVFYAPAAEASMYILMALVLLFRPRGLLGERFEKFE